MNTKEFLEKLHGKDSINFRLIKDKHVINLNGRYEGKIIETLKQLNEQGYNAYFVVNGGGTHSKDINKINAVFVDFDCGRDENKQYFPLEITRQFKDKCIEKVNSFVYKPTFIVETRNGVHVYWLVNEDSTVEQFLQCQLRLIQFFDSDKAVKTPERVMRLPDYYWMKDINNKFMCNVVAHNDIRYDIQDIINALPEIKVDEHTTPTHKTKNNIIGSLGGRNIQESTTLSHIKKKDIEVLQAIIKPNQIILKSHEEVYAYLKKQDLNLFLGLPKVFNCIFHQDNNPSANIFIDPKTEYYWYKCFSEKCGVVKDIISITENLLKCTTPKALKFLRQVYKIDFAETEWQKEMKSILDENIRLLLDNERFQSIAPSSYTRIRSYISDLIVITNYAREKIYTETFTDSRGLPLFFASLEYINKLCSRNDAKRFVNILALLSYLGLINKLKESEIPPFMLNESKHQSALKQQVNLIGYYSIPSYCDDTLSFSEDKAKEFKEKGLTMKGMSYELIYRTLGEEEAMRVYPQLAGKVLTDASEDFAFDVDRAVLDLLSNQHYATERQVLDYFKGNKEVLRCRLKRVLPETLDKYDLIKIKLNKTLKENLNIDGSGYPYIIMTRDEFEFYSDVKDTDIKVSLSVSSTIFDYEKNKLAFLQGVKENKGEMLNG